MLDQYLNRITQGDCLTLFQSIPDNSIDITFADPPFNLNKKYHSTNDRLALQAYLNWCERWLNEMVRVTKPSGSIFIHNIPKWLTYYTAVLNQTAQFRHWISWDAPTSPMGKTLQPAHYGILFYTKDIKQHKFYEIRYPHKRCRKCKILHKDYGGKKSLLHPFGPLLSDVWTDIHRIKHHKYRDAHPCQLPIHLLERILLMATDEGDIVLDPFSGTGTTAIAAKRLGRQFIGFELDQEYATIASTKLTQEQFHSKLGASWVSIYLDQIITLRDQDWTQLTAYYTQPKTAEDIDTRTLTIKPDNYAASLFDRLHE
ncbi:site-specific DNA-methyltransferase [Rhodoferax sp. 4810]|uniref:Methyltransferase n=1 Tax=Thiospirillum jenense TaxID=1653858 RepID=A0A839HKP2_9GAMM|nr:site-specific DNA-methyltransferase [Thiospirillum jenense]MBB1077097.1 site-specific DNA-methyltransferase [Rhodoferax jenense]MBB1127167.1 site-specific DNA-methyltransferase [Thiospirillum jenense]